MAAQLILKAGKERSVMRRHPWIFEGSVDQLQGRARTGDTVEVITHDGRALGRAAWSPHSQIRARMWTFDPQQSIDDVFFRRRITDAVTWRRALPELQGQNGMRLLHGESDGLPGVIADQYGDTVVVQLTSAGADKWRDAIVSALQRATGCTRIFERSDSDVRKLEGLELRTGWLLGEGLPSALESASAQGGEQALTISEYGINIGVDIQHGHKTGFYLDQRENRRLCGQLANGRRVLNCFCYTGGFSLHALAGGAQSVLSIDSSGPALAQAARNVSLNPNMTAATTDGRVEWREANVFDELRILRKAGQQFDLIILDPPKFAPSAAHARQASRAYKDINLLGFRLLAPGGLLMTYSCSGGIGHELFQSIVAGAASDAGVDARILRRLGPGADHPVGLAIPEGDYLKGLLVQVGGA